MSLLFRVVRETRDGGGFMFTIREVTYNDEGDIVAMEDEGATPTHAGRYPDPGQGLVRAFHHMAIALKRPMVDGDSGPPYRELSAEGWEP